MKVVAVHANNTNCHLYGSQFLNRTVAFLGEHDCEGDEEFIWHEVSYEMRNTPSNKLCLVGVEGRVVCGHLLAELQIQYGVKSVMITQIAMDHPDAEKREKMFELGLPLVAAYAKAHEATNIKCWAMNEKVAEIFSRYGLEPKGVVVMETKLLKQKEE